METTTEARTVEQQFFELFGASLDWFKRPDGTGFDVRLLDLWLGHPQEGVVARLDRLFGPKAKEVVFSIIEEESTKRGLEWGLGTSVVHVS